MANCTLLINALTCSPSSSRSSCQLLMPKPDALSLPPLTLHSSRGSTAPSPTAVHVIALVPSLKPSSVLEKNFKTLRDLVIWCCVNYTYLELVV